MSPKRPTEKQTKTHAPFFLFFFFNAPHARHLRRRRAVRHLGSAHSLCMFLNERETKPSEPRFLERETRLVTYHTTPCTQKRKLLACQKNRRGRLAAPDPKCRSREPRSARSGERERLRSRTGPGPMALIFHNWRFNGSRKGAATPTTPGRAGPGPSSSGRPHWHAHWDPQDACWVHGSLPRRDVERCSTVLT